MDSFKVIIANLELFYYFSTDEVFGPSDNVEKFKEWDLVYEEKLIGMIKSKQGNKRKRVVKRPATHHKARKIYKYRG